MLTCWIWNIEFRTSLWFWWSELASFKFSCCMLRSTDKHPAVCSSQRLVALPTLRMIFLHTWSAETQSCTRTHVSPLRNGNTHPPSHCIISRDLADHINQPRMWCVLFCTADTATLPIGALLFLSKRGAPNIAPFFFLILRVCLRLCHVSTSQLHNP